MKHLDSKEKMACVLIILILFLGLSGFLLEKKAALAQFDQLEQTAEVAGLGPETEVPIVVGRIIAAVLFLVGIVLVVMLIAGGVIWMTSGGSADQVTKAKKLITSALIGLIIVVLSYSISRFVVEKLSGATKETVEEEGG